MQMGYLEDAAPIKRVPSALKGSEYILCSQMSR